ncbi:intraflagellar transport protein 57 [Micromonas commoda]|uniref:Intraflagellar transport protein 57 n=1 Tax=Micromonas commoda (strain RCC299 / NOUM17 / CCMP2709) TaxID=296587 RepID=C1FF89_MICCC|nr:intraflagellar transport protein 57 [Micromonas commoda]ACO68707.1 intraflagellar transport protein 57 [Micromonas commoda]|eukprot:XP_002507449.1 intraflagellar transport protein 57 [Micromonas commoda]
MADDGELTVELAVEPEVGMELCLEKLKMLRYERDFLTSRRPPWPPCTRTHFAVPTPGQNTNELFHHFTSLCAHLLTLCGRRFRPPDQFDDPNATCAAIFAELKACGFATPSFAPGKLRHGHGRECVGVLNGLCDLAMARHYQHGLSRPVYPRAGDAEGGDAVMSDLAASDPSSALEEYAVASALDRDAPLDASLKKVLRKTEEEIEERRAIESAVDAREWRVELERVAAKLKAVSKEADAKDWRSNLDACRKAHAAVCAKFPDVRVALDRVGRECKEVVDKIETRESYVNARMEPRSDEYKSTVVALESAQKEYDEGNERVSSLTNELARIGERLERAKGEMASKGDEVSDATPLTKLRDVVDKMNEEMRTMEVKIAIARNALGHASMRRAASGGTGRAGAAAAAAAL